MVETIGIFFLMFINGCTSHPLSTGTEPSYNATNTLPSTQSTDKTISLTPSLTFTTTTNEKLLVNGNQGILILNSDGTDITSVSEAMAREDSDPSLSPDGTKIIFGGKDGEIYIRSIDKDQITNLTNYPGQDRRPVWSSDGTKIAFESVRSEHFGIFVMDPDGSNVINVVSMPNDVRLGGWSPDSRYIVFTNLAYPTEGVIEGVAYSPIYSLQIIDALTGSTRTLLEESECNISNLIAPVFSPDGTRIAFQGIEQKQIAVYLIDTNGSNLRKLTYGDDNYSNPVWSPDGERIVVYVSPPRSKPTESAYLAIFNLDGNFEARLPNLDGIVTSWIRINR